jgi:hypothetical protein
VTPNSPTITALAVALCIAGASCASDDSGGASSATGALGTTLAGTTTESVATEPAPTTTESAPTTTEPAPTTTEPAPTTTEPAGDDVRTMVEILASDEMNGRDNLTPGSQLARDYIVGELERFADPALGEGTDGYVQPFDLGTNIIALLPGGDLSDEYVIIGAHYDHVGSNCGDVSAADDICNGATDNATGVAAVIEVARSIAAEGVPRRSVLIALWDAEEDGLVGSGRYVADPIVPLEQTVVYINFDIQGSNLLPSLANSTLLVGAETGGPNLVDAAGLAAEASTLDTLKLSLLFGQGRSDHAVFVDAGVPSVFLSDATNSCYHTVGDELDMVDFGKLDLQLIGATVLLRTLISTDEIPVLDPAAPPTTYDDAVQMLRLVSAAEPDFALLGPEGRASAEQYLVDLRTVVDAGPGSFDDNANAVLLGGAGAFVGALAQVGCGPSIE